MDGLATAGSSGPAALAAALLAGGLCLSKLVLPLLAARLDDAAVAVRRVPGMEVRARMTVCARACVCACYVSGASGWLVDVRSL